MRLFVANSASSLCLAALLRSEECFVEKDTSVDAERRLFICDHRIDLALRPGFARVTYNRAQVRGRYSSKVVAIPPSLAPSFVCTLGEHRPRVLAIS